ncbi:hypothetical protein Goari_003458, partial [Gossypium aridum]|nr:hypothetical protein [Gossypium aridum]
MDYGDGGGASFTKNSSDDENGQELFSLYPAKCTISSHLYLKTRITL